MKKLFYSISLLFSTLLLAQVGINTDLPNSKAALHISERKISTSTNPDVFNGVLIQRYTTDERNNLTLTSADHGLTIFNKTENCYNYWDGSLLKWEKLCGQLEFAKLDLTNFNCSNDLEIKGSYIRDKAITSSEYIKVKVNVQDIGSYEFKAIANNGYSFSATGEFLTTGIQTVILYGTGVPSNAQTDTFILTLNGTEVCNNLVKINVINPVKPLSNIKLGDIGNQPEGAYAFATTWFKAFMNSWSNFGPIAGSKVYTDGNPLAPVSLSSNLSDVTTMLQYDILAVSYSVAISEAQRTALKQFATTPGKTLIIHTEGNGTPLIGLLNDLIGDITLTSSSFSPDASVGVTDATAANWVVNDPANAPFRKGVFGDVTGTVFIEHATTAPSIYKTDLDASQNVQYIAYRDNFVSVFKIKNKNVFWIEDGAVFYGGFGTDNGPACFTPVSGIVGAIPIPCSLTATNGRNSGGSIFAANMVYWALQQVQ